VAFNSAKEGVMVMGDIVGRKNDLKPSQYRKSSAKDLNQARLVHNHFSVIILILCLYGCGSGNHEAMAQKQKR